MLTDRRELESKLANSIKTIKRKKNVVNDIKEELMNKYDIAGGSISTWFRSPEDSLPELDLREFYLINEQVYLKTGNLELIPEDHFTEVEIKEARKYSAEVKRDKIDFPITLTNATVVGNAAYSVPMSVQTIDALMSNGLLTYDFELQREAKFIRGRDNSIRKKPTLIKKNVDEIEEHLFQGTLVPSVLVYNCMTRSSDTGNEIIFDATKGELTITSGTEMAIVDGFHRTMGAVRAVQRQPDINFNFIVLITNYSTKQAQQYQAQLGKASEVSKVRIQELEANRHSDGVVRQLREESDLKGLISQTNRIHHLNKELVSYNVLADTIDEQFHMNNKAESMDVGDYLVDFFNILLGAYSNEFLENPVECKKTSLMCDNNMFVGYIVLARRMFEMEIKPKELRKVIKDIDFSKENNLWKEIGVLETDGNLNSNTNKLRKNIADYFETIDLGELVK
ncbi:hypothetical protein FZC83_02055 [Rossellomorea marisflavi]|uniref:DGQHR domain-containing protein n=1 Tax=Rossellomorea marisflavi TaxID=189381 RepID=A0A5D4S0B7_9BACI|nr:DNA sulfur modification protein DndB [Rossellomorea marisflavi]TYS56379.1 hypothetical protein FZC83_02055 [Rossellomorea marisflavi]